MRVWVASLIFYSSTFIVCEILRYIVGLLLPPKLLRTQLALEFIGTLQICVPMFDVGTILDVYGLWGVFIEITAIELANFYLVRDAISNPCPLITTCYRKWKMIRNAVRVFAVQLLGAYVSFHCARAFWKLGIHPLHQELLDTDVCTADLTVAVYVGCLVEGAATLVGKAFEHYIEDWEHAAVAGATFNGFLCALGIHYTGMYANPLVAWACTFNCEGASHIAHLFVYWLSPLIAWWFAEQLFGHEDAVEDDDVCEEKKEE